MSRRKHVLLAIGALAAVSVIAIAVPLAMRSNEQETNLSAVAQDPTTGSGPKSGNPEQSEELPSDSPSIGFVDAPTTAPSISLLFKVQAQGGSDYPTFDESYEDESSTPTVFGTSTTDKDRVRREREIRRREKRVVNSAAFHRIFSANGIFEHVSADNGKA